VFECVFVCLFKPMISLHTARKGCSVLPVKVVGSRREVFSGRFDTDEKSKNNEAGRKSKTTHWREPACTLFLRYIPESQDQ